MADGKKIKKVSPILIFGIVVLIILSIIIFGNINQEPQEKTVSESDVELLKFDNLSNSVEIWLINIGEETATDINLHLRVRQQNGTVIFDDGITLSSLVLRYNETCTGIYNLSPPLNQKLYFTIEISWDSGRNTYSKTT